MLNKNTLPALLIAIGLTLSGFFIANALEIMKQPQRYVTVKGLSERVVDADQAIWEIKFTNSSDDIGALYDDIATSRAATLAFLKSVNINQADLTLQPVQVTDNQTNSYNTNQKSKRFVALSSITINTHQINAIRDALQKAGDLIKNGVVLSQSTVRYQFTQLNAIKPDMLREATENARKAAEIFAQESASQIEQIRHASQGQFTITDADASYGNDNPRKQVRIVSTVQYGLK